VGGDINYSRRRIKIGQLIPKHLFQLDQHVLLKYSSQIKKISKNKATMNINKNIQIDHETPWKTYSNKNNNSLNELHNDHLQKLFDQLPQLQPAIVDELVLRKLEESHLDWLISKYAVLLDINSSTKVKLLCLLLNNNQKGKYTEWIVANTNALDLNKIALTLKRQYTPCA
jgi:hypothetical protein